MLRISTCICAALLAGAVPAAARPIAATVRAATSRWASPELIVTDLEIVDAEGAHRVLTVPGGTADGLAMTFSHHPIPGVGDRVAVDGGRVRLEVGAAMGGTARFGVKRTKSGTAVWRSSCIQFISDTTAFTDVADVPALLDRAFAAWATDCSPLAVERISGDAEIAIDGKSVIVFRTQRWCRPATADDDELCYSPEVAATTRTLSVDRLGEPDDGRIIETDIEINAVDFAFFHDGRSFETAGEPVDFLSVVTHEIGHAFGLAHNCATGDEPPARDLEGAEVPRCEDVAQDPAYTLATMYPTVGRGEIHKETLAASDIEGVCAVLHPSATCNVEFTAGCDAGGGTGGGLVVLVLVLARRRRSLAWLAATGCVGAAPVIDRDASEGGPSVVLEGLVVDYFTGAPLGEIVLETRGFAPERRVISDRDGAYRLDELPTRAAFALVSAPDDRNVATATAHRAVDGETFAEATVIAALDVERQAAALELVLEPEAGMIVAEITRGDAAATGLSLADVSLVDEGGAPVTARRAWFGVSGDVDPRVVTSLPTRGAARVAFLGVPGGTYTLAVTERGATITTTTATTIELPTGGAAIAELALPISADTGAP
jgi:Metallo-peptidase family M12B Reprolysin-like